MHFPAGYCRGFVPIIALVTLQLIGVPAVAGDVASFHRLRFLPGASWSNARDVSADGSVVLGQSGQSAFLWTEAGGIVSIGHPPGTTYIEGRCLNATGTVVAGHSSQFGSWTWSAGSGFTPIVDILDPDDELVGPTAMSAGATTIVGQGQFNNGQFATGAAWVAPGHMYFMPALGSGSAPMPNDVNAAGTIAAGNSPSDEGQRAVRWTIGGGVDNLGVVAEIGGLASSGANAISADGSTIVGYSTNTSLNKEAIRWTQADGMRHIGWLVNGSSEAHGVSVDGSRIVGESGVLLKRAFLWDAENGMQDLDDIVIDFGLDAGGLDLQNAVAISDDGTTIVGWGKQNGNGATESFVLKIPSLPPPCPGDLNGDRAVDIGDLNAVLGNFGTMYDINDLNLVIGNFGTLCGP